MPYDDSIKLFGTVGNEVTAVTTTLNGTAVYVGRNRVLHADLRVAGTSAGTNPSVVVSILESTTSSGTAFTTAIAFAAVTGSMVATTGGGSGPSSVTFRSTKDYLRATASVSATATFSAIELRLRPTGEPAIP